jgi:hypothetical protein
MKYFKLLLILAAASVVGCTRIETGEIGLRVGFDKQVQQTELQPGSFNQEIIGDVLVFPVKQLSVGWSGLRPMTADKSSLGDLDFAVVYNVNPASVAELYTKLSRSFHSYENGETYLMHNYMSTLANSAAFKAVAKVNVLDATSARSQIETDIASFMREALVADHLDKDITIDLVQVKNILPAQSIIDSANNVINAQNLAKAKQVEVGTAKLEAERLAMLSSNGQNVRYMEAKALQDIAEGVKDGKVRTVIVPFDFKGMINVSDK